jgi:glutathione-specific gamma-glutamylcyclotransferase
MWIFAYGSLMWNPGFKYEKSCKATLKGYKRSLCVKAQVHRGTPEKPGLVLGLEKDSSSTCVGMVFQIAKENELETLEYLRKREMIRDVYLEVRLPVQLDNLQISEALCYIVNPHCKEYDEKYSLEQKVNAVANSVGISGTNFDYVKNVLTELDKIHIVDVELKEIFSLATHQRK